MDAAWIGLIGVLAGVVLGSGLTELFRRSSRIENYASQVFSKRLQVYEELYRKMMDGHSVAQDLMDSKDDAEKRHAVISAVISDVATYCDDNAFYLHDELSLHCIGSFMGAEDVAELKGKKREDAAQSVRDNMVNARTMIQAEAGIDRINRFFGKVTRAKHSSPLIERYRELKESKG